MTKPANFFINKNNDPKMNIELRFEIDFIIKVDSCIKSSMNTLQLTYLQLFLYFLRFLCYSPACLNGLNKKIIIKRYFLRTFSMNTASLDTFFRK